MGKKLFVGNLAYSVTENDLKDAFAKVGEVVSARVITDQATGRSKGFGFVEMASDEDGEKAISSLNGATLMDRAMNVSEARPQRERSGMRTGDRGRRGHGGKRQDSWR